MITIFSITFLLIFLYLLYPFWLMTLDKYAEDADPGLHSDAGVSVILLSCNGYKYLDAKINALLREIEAFDRAELIVIDDGSDDGSRELLQSHPGTSRLRIICSPGRMGIPHSMNLGADLSKYEVLVFCDQRQEIPAGIIQRLLGPLSGHSTGAVSSCISHIGRNRSHSLARRHENFLKAMEGRSGNLIGVYGPLYAIRKECYSPIPGGIILDDLWLSLHILRSRNIILLDDCHITDDDLMTLYDYRRTRRYLRGLIQLLKERKVINGLSLTRLLMLGWHKYFRIIIPVSLFISYVTLGFTMTGSGIRMIAFSVATLLIFLALLPGRSTPGFALINLLRINIYYFISGFDILINDLLLPSLPGKRKPGASTGNEK